MEKKRWNDGERIELWWQENIIDYDNIYNSMIERKKEEEKQAKEPSHHENNKKKKNTS